MNGIRRKIGASAPPAAAGRGAEAQWPLALARAAQGAGGLDLVAGDPRGGVASLAEVLDLLPERGLIMVLQGPGGATGIMALDPAVLAALVERQTLGRVTARAVAPRRPTRTDAAIAAGLVDGALAALDAALEEDGDRVWAAGFRSSVHLEDARPLGLLLEDASFRLLRVEASLGGGAKSGAVVLALPAAGRGSAPPPRSAAGDAAAAMVFRAALAEQVMGAGATLEAVIARVTLPLSQVMALAPGEVLRLGAAAIDRIDLEGPDGLRVAGGRMGQTRGMRALRIQPESPAAARGQGSLAPGIATAEEAVRRTGTG
ncbi:MAG: FliM/FliN family flagellar motor switch protein [Paracoccaceae bacterium]|nr:MAG: FliM/FliN family flagellar motor switch protein [Paracoccaceae bacterium]